MKILPGGRYEICLTSKSKAIDLSSNKDLTWKRHKKMCERAQRNETLDDYKVVFKEWDMIFLEIIEKIEDKGENSYFLPHRPIVKDDNITTKIRPVFDASARVTGQSSLNDLLYKGPDLIEQIPDTSDRFRRYRIGLSANIEKAFLQLGITPKHRDVLRFFYPDEGEEIVYRHHRMVFGVSSSPFLLVAVIALLLENVPTDDTQLGSKLKLSFDIDNCVKGVNDIAQQDGFILQSKEILSRGYFNLRNWESNVESTLCSVTLTPKILLQNTWKLKLSWNSSLPEEIVKPFFKWWKENKILSDVKIPRYFEINDSTQMHAFVDACKEVYATCIFFRSNTSQGMKVTLVRANTRVALLKQLIRSVQARSFTDDNSIIRVKTRITEGIDPPNFLSPILPPNNCILSQRLVEHFHLRNHHIGTQLPLSIIREKYWITGGRRTVRKIWNACVKYRRFKSKSPVTDPVSLPSDRVKDAAVFEVVGVDLAGPLFVSNGVIRGAYNELVDIDWNEVSRYAEIQLITWKCIPPTAAWWGGFWERLVRTLIPGKDGLVRTVKLKTQSCILMRPIQRLFPLEMSGNDITNPSLQKVQQTDSSVNCPNPDTLKATEKSQVTRCGRLVKKPDKLNLLILTDVFD
ncbi:integrase catalytic domain-containing protein [Trichonephila clavipes]|nr:integrase catalytic domain-containing protein [Trichonephila clavipes]